MSIGTQFEWTRGYAYEIASWSKDKSVQVIRQVDKGRYRFKPLEVSKPAYLDFANCDGSAEGCLKFASTFGLLETSAGRGVEERLAGWQRQIRNMKGSIAMLGATSGDQPGGILRSRSRRMRAKMGSMDVWLECPDPLARPILVLKPRNLLDAMLLQLAQTITGGGVLRVCKQCQNWFEVGSDEGRRSISVFCKEACKNRYHYLQRRAGK